MENGRSSRSQPAIAAASRSTLLCLKMLSTVIAASPAFSSPWMIGLGGISVHLFRIVGNVNALGRSVPKSGSPSRYEVRPFGANEAARSALGHHRTFCSVQWMSALPPKADVVGHGRDVRSVPKQTFCTAVKNVVIRSPRRRGQVLPAEW